VPFQNIKRRILIPLGIALGGLALVIIFSFYQNNIKQLDNQIMGQLSGVEALFQLVQEQEAELMGGLIEALKRDPCLQRSFRESNRRKLLHCASPIFEQIRAKHQITHFYFHTPDRLNFLRVHNPPRHGDYINRFTMKDAAILDKPAQGIELGPLGTFTLRVVHPWYIGDSLVGYMELGKEIDHIAPTIKQAVGVDLIFIIEKQFLKQENWEEGLKMLGHDGDWDQIPDSVIIEHTADIWSPELEHFGRNNHFAQNLHNHASFTLTDNKHSYQAHGIALYDAGKRRLGNILIINDTTEVMQNLRQTSLLVSGTVLAIGGILFLLFNIYLTAIQSRLDRTHNRLERKIDEHKKAETLLRENELRLTHEVAQRGKAAAAEMALSTLLRLSVQPLTLREFLQQSLEELIHSVPWLKLLPKGCIFVTENQGHGDTLELAAEFNLSPETKKDCAQIPFGTCLCGQAAASGEIQFANDIDHRHSITYDGMEPHGHFTVPIQQGEMVLGVLNLYLSHEHPHSEEEGLFLHQIADVLSLGIQRCYSEEALVLAKDAAEAASRAKSDFLATMSHEIRTPMNGILGMAELMQESDLSAEHAEYINVISQSGQHLLAIINDILDLSRIEAQKLELASMPFDLEATAQDAIQMISSQAEGKGLELALYFAPDCPQHLIGDAGYIRQILLNLLGNAVKFTDQGHVLVEITGQLHDEKSAAIHVGVEDTGIGIDSTSQDRLFDSFTQADASTTRRHGGSGLGLAICKQLLNMMGGKIGMDSTPGKGSNFWFRLTLPLAQPLQPSQHLNLSNVHALVVDSDSFGQQVFHKQLQGLGMSVESTSSQEQALLKLENAITAGRPFQVALVDYPIPGISLEQLEQALRTKSSPTTIPLILITETAKRGESSYFAENGFAAHLIKPIRLNKLRHTLTEVLAGTETNGSEAQNLSGSQTDKDTGPLTPQFEGRILVVEDNQINRTLACTLLEKMGLTVETAKDGEEVAPLMEQSEYDLIFMDCQMPKLNGYDTTRLIREQEASQEHHIPIIALTANAMASDRKKCLDAGMDDYISKPFSAEDLVHVLEKWLQGA
jgi:signal transduction histidine kinase/DNA-binding response OmpR family regulator